MEHNRRSFLVASVAGTAFFKQLGDAREVDSGSGGKTPAEDIPYTVAGQTWPAALGNHRARVRVSSVARVAAAHIVWRRHDQHPEEKAVLVFGPDGKPVSNAVAHSLNSEACDLLFEAAEPGDYLVYYFPQEDPATTKKRDSHEGHLEHKGQYRVPENTVDPAWLARLQTETPASAEVIEFQARTAFDSFYPMEIAATQEELESLGRRYPQPFLIFPEDREHPVRMTDALPLRWIRSGLREQFTAEAYRGELCVFQVGIYAQPELVRSEVPITIHFEPLSGADGQTIPATAFECFQAGGIDTAGEPFEKKITASPGQVTVLWCGVQIPLDSQPGAYTGGLLVRIGENSSSPPARLELHFTVLKDFLRAGGVDQPARLARLNWLNSKIGLEETITSPYTPLEVEGRTVKCLGRQVTFNDQGFPQTIRAGDNQILAGPVSLRVEETAKAVDWTSTSRLVSSSAARVAFHSESESSSYRLVVETTMEFDGGIGFDVRFTPKRSARPSNIALEIPFIAEAVPYSVGMGLTGGTRPASWRWQWSEQPQRWKDQGSNLEYFVWLGGTKAGLFCRLKSPLEDWKNGTKGGVSIEEDRSGRVVFRAGTGGRALHAGQVLQFSFRLLPTPLKPLSPEHWKYRYAHAYRPIEEVEAAGATVVNIHHDTLPNLYINYPFLNLDLLGPYIAEAHAHGLKAKIYYTVRELTTHLPELWAFRALGEEIYRTGGTQGHGNSQLDFWLQEHLVSNYTPGWITRTPAGDIDAAIRVYFNSRLDNFYLAGLRWLLENVPIDGLYLDEIGYPRDIMQRVRRVLETRPGAMIDMHGNHTWWSCNCPVGYYMEHLPYIDRLWFGESFDPDSPPDFWLIEMSGIPFGLSSDMLQRPHLWRGMLFGMTHRAFYTAPSPTPLWKLWDEFGIDQAEMLGWWESNCPVRTGRSDVLATVYKRPGKALIAVASWSKQTAAIRLAIDWKALGIAAASAKLIAPELMGFQPSESFNPGEPLEVPAKRGWILQLEA